MSTGFVYLRPLYVMFARANGAYASSAQEAWGAVFDWLDENRLRQKVTVGYGILRDNPRMVSVDQCRYDACIEIPEGMESKMPPRFSIQKLPGGAFARQRHVGLSSEISKTITALRDEWVAESGLILDRSRPILEIYRDDPEVVNDGQRRIDICVPVSSERSNSEDKAA